MSPASELALSGNRAMFTFLVEGCDEPLRVVRFGGHEAISTLFEYRLEIASATLPLDSLVGRSALLTIHGVDGPRYIHGLVCEAGYFGESSSYTLYELTIVPAIWSLHQRVSSRIFQEQTTPQLLVKVLEGAGIQRSQYRLELLASYAPRDYSVQYQESDLDFISRLMESDGLFYYFEHRAERHILVITDRAEGGPPIAGETTLRFADEHTKERVTHFRLSEGVRPQRVTLRDKNLHQPHQMLEASRGTGEREVYESPGRYQEPGKDGPERGGYQARLRLEALQVGRRRGFGTSDSPRLLPGHVFSLADVARGHLEGTFRVIRVSHRGEQPQALEEWAAGSFDYSNDFECTESKAPFRAPRMTPRPAVRGAQTATVVGPESEEVHVDEHGRVKVQFHWDRRDAHDETSSCWVRVSQMWAGNGFGSMFIPRIGHEVIVDFLEGDPDRPIITGRIYTGFNMPPYPLPDHKSRSTIRTESTPGGGGSNELRFEDMKGSEEVYLHGQKDWNIVVEHDKAQKIGHDESLTVGHDRSETIGNDKTIMVASMHKETIGVDMTLMVGANLSVAVGATAMLAVGGGVGVSIDGSKAETVAGDSMNSVTGEQQLTIGGSASESVGGAKSVDVAGDSSENVSGGKGLSVAENLTASAGKNIALSASKHLNIKTGESLNVSAGKNAVVVVGEKMTLRCGDATVTIHKSGEVTIQSKKLNIKASGDVVVQGSNVKFN